VSVARFLNWVGPGLMVQFSLQSQTQCMRNCFNRDAEVICDILGDGRSMSPAALSSPHNSLPSEHGERHAVIESTKRNSCTRVQPRGLLLRGNIKLARSQQSLT
jgi:hypothetical protein